MSRVYGDESQALVESQRTEDVVAHAAPRLSVPGPAELLLEIAAERLEHGYEIFRWSLDPRRPGFPWRVHRYRDAFAPENRGQSDETSNAASDDPGSHAHGRGVRELSQKLSV